MSDTQPDEPQPEQTDNGPRPEDGDQPDDQQHTGERDDLIKED